MAQLCAKKISSDYNKCFSMQKKKPHFRCISRTEIDLSEKDLYLLYALLCIMCTVHLQCIRQSTVLEPSKTRFSKATFQWFATFLKWSQLLVNLSILWKSEDWLRIIEVALTNTILPIFLLTVSVIHYKMYLPSSAMTL